MALPGGSIGVLTIDLDLDSSRYVKSQQTLLKQAQTASDVLEQNFKNLGIKSDAVYDLMRARAEKSYEAIIKASNDAANTHKITANDILRVEEAKVARINELNDQQYGHQKTLEEKLVESYKNLGVKSSAEIEQMRASIIASYDMIASHGKESADGIIRAEEAKNAKLQTLNELQYGHQKTLEESIAESYKNLGIKSSAEIEQMRANIIASYDMIANSSKATADDIIRAEEVKNAKLNELNEQQYGHQRAIEESFRNLGIKSSAEMDQMRESIVNDYNIIANSSKSTAEDIIHAEEAKNARIKELDNQQFGERLSLLDKFKAHWMEITAAIYAAEAAFRIVERIWRTVEGWVQLDIAQERADRSLKAVMVTTGRYSDQFYQETLGQAKALARLTGFTNQTIESAQKFMMTMNGVGNDVIPRATKAAINLAAIMGGGESSLQQAAISVERAMQGATEGVRRHGIVIDTNVFKERGAIGVLEELEKKIEGQIEALGKGSGAWKIFGSQVDEAKEKMGSFIEKGVRNSGLLDFLQSWVDDLNVILDHYANTTENFFTHFNTILYHESRLTNQLAGQPQAINVTPDQLKAAAEAAQQIRSAFIDQMQRFAPMPSILPVESIVLELTQEQKTAMTEMEDFMKSITQTQYQKAVEEITQKFNAWGKVLGDTSEFTKAFALALDKLDEKLNENINKKIKELSLSEYEYKKYLIDEEYKNYKENLKNIESATKLHNLELEKLDKEFYAKREEWRKLYSEEATGRPALTSLPGEYIDIKEFESADYALKQLILDQEAFNRKVKEFEGTEIFKEYNKNLKASENEIKKQHAEWKKTVDSQGIAFNNLDKQLDKLSPIFDRGEILRLTSIAEDQIKLVQGYRAAMETSQYESQFQAIMTGNSDMTLKELQEQYKATLTQINDDTQNELKDLYDKVNKTWIDLANSMSDAFKDAFKDIILTGKVDFDKLGDSIKNTFAELIAESVKKKMFQPVFDQMFNQFKIGIDKMFSYERQQQAQQEAGQTTTTAGAATGTGGSSWGSSAGLAMMGGMELYNDYQRAREGNLPWYQGTLKGAAIGSYYGGPWGALIGAAAGTGVVEFMNANYGPETSKIELIYKAIDGQIEAVAERFKHTPKNQELLDTVEQALQDQIDFFSRISEITSTKMADFTITLKGESAFDIQNKVYRNAMEQMIAKQGAISQVTPGFDKKIQELWMESFKDLTSETIKGAFGSEGYVYGYGPYGGYKTTDVKGALPEDELWNILQITDPDKRLEELKKWLSAGFSTSFYIPEMNYGDYISPGGMGSPIYEGAGQFLSTEDLKAWDDYFQEISERFFAIQGTIAQSIGNAFLESIDTAEFQNFEDSISRLMYENVKAGLAQGFTNQVLDIVMHSNTGLVKAYGLLGQYAAGEGDVTAKQVTDAFASAFDNLGSTFDELIKPIFDGIATGMSQLSEALGINTNATGSNTDALIGTNGSIDQFVASLYGSDLAPGTSTAQILSQYQSALAAAQSDPSKFGALQSILTGNYLPFMQGVSPNYDTDFQAAVNDIMGLKGYWGSAEEDENILPPIYWNDDERRTPFSDRGYSNLDFDASSMSMSRGRAGTGGDGIDYDRLADAVYQRFAGPLIDLKETASAPKEITGDLNIKGDVGKMTAEAIRSNPDVNHALRDRFR